MLDNQSVARPVSGSGTVPRVSAELLLQQIRSGVAMLVIDVRDRSELIETGAIAGARCFPFAQLGQRLGELTARHDTSVVVVSQDERRSSAAAATLALAGFSEVTALEGGMKRWLALGFPVEDRGVESIRIRASIVSSPPSKR